MPTQIKTKVNQKLMYEHSAHVWYSVILVLPLRTLLQWRTSTIPELVFNTENLTFISEHMTGHSM